MEATVAAHQLPELPKPKSTEVVTIQMGQPCSAHHPPFFLIPFLFHSGSLFCGFPSSTRRSCLRNSLDVSLLSSDPSSVRRMDGAANRRVICRSPLRKKRPRIQWFGFTPFNRASSLLVTVELRGHAPRIAYPIAACWSRCFAPVVLHFNGPHEKARGDSSLQSMDRNRE